MTISSITPTEVSVFISGPLLQNLLSIGYQIILAAPEQLNILNTIWSNSVWTSQKIEVVPNTFFLAPQLGFEYLNTEIQRQNTTFLSTNPIQYNLVVWDGGGYTANTHQQVQLLYIFNQTYLPLFCNHFEAIQKVYTFQPQSTSVKMLILETNQQFTSIGSYQIFLEKGFSTINFEITVQCLPTQNIQSSFYISIGQISQIQETQYMHSCSSQYQVITYYSRFKQATPAVEQLQIVITSNSLNITQINIYNQFEISSQQLVAIQVV